MKSIGWICLVFLLVLPISFSKGIDIKNQGNNITTISTDSGMEYTLNSTSCNFISIKNSKINNYNVVGGVAGTAGLMLDYNKSYYNFTFGNLDKVDNCTMMINSSQMVDIIGYAYGLKREYIIYNYNPWIQVFDNVTALIQQRSLFDYAWSNPCNITYGNGSTSGIEFNNTNWAYRNFKEGWVSIQNSTSANTDSLFYIFDELENNGYASLNMLESDEANQCRMQRYSNVVDAEFKLNGWENTTYRVGISYYNPQNIRTLWNETYFSNRTTVSAISPTTYNKIQADYVNMSGNGTLCVGNIRIKNYDELDGSSPADHAKTVLLECGNFSSGITNIYFYNKNASTDTINYAVSDVGVSDLVAHYNYNTTDWVYGSNDPLGRTGIIGNETSICGNTKVCTYGNMKSNAGSISVFMPLDNFNVTNTKFVMLTNNFISTLNITAYDEKTYDPLTFNITIANLTNSVTSTLITNYDKSWENLPIGNVEIYITADGYVQRKFTTTINEDSHLIIKVYLLKITDGSFTRFHIEDQAGSVISNVDVTAYKYIDFQWQVVETAESDGSGVATTFLDPLNTYTIEFEKSGYNSANYSIQPSSSDYTITLTAVSGYQPAEISLTNISYSVLPQYNVSATNVSFNFTIHSFDSKLEWWFFNVTYNGTSFFVSNMTTSSGGTNSTTLDLGNGSFNPNATIITYVAFKKQNVTGEYWINTSYWIWKNIPPAPTSLVGIGDYIRKNMNIGTSDKYNELFFGFGVLMLALIVGSSFSGEGSGFVVLGVIGLGIMMGYIVFAPIGSPLIVTTGVLFGIVALAYLSYIFIRGGI